MEGKTILVTGASSGIGRGIAIECSKMGAKVIITARNKERLLSVYRELYGDNHQFIVADLINRDNIINLVNEIPLVDGIVHSTGVGISLLFPFCSTDKVRSVIDVNLISPIELLYLIVKEKNTPQDKKRYPLGRYGNSKDIALGAIYLLSDAASWVTRSNLVIDGGFTLL